MTTTKRLKPNEITEPGYYWCSHEIDWSKSYWKGWNIIEVADGRFQIPGVIDDDGLFPKPAQVPDYVQFIGPLEPPKDAT